MAHQRMSQDTHTVAVARVWVVVLLTTAWYHRVSGPISPGLQWVHSKPSDISDHAPLSCSFYLPAAVGHRRTPPSLADRWPTIKWDSSEAKRVQYVSKLRDCEPQRQQILNQLSSGVPLAVVSNQWFEVIWKVAADVYGVKCDRGRIAHGRMAKSWFKYCRDQW
jgi:hypothetical protein